MSALLLVVAGVIAAAIGFPARPRRAVVTFTPVAGLDHAYRVGIKFTEEA